MPGASFVATAPAASAAAAASPSLVKRPRFVRSRAIEKEPPRYGEKPYDELVLKAFDGPVLRLSQKMRLLEEADARKIRRGDALDLIAATQRELEARHAVKPETKVQTFFRKYAIFVACYAMFALIWCVILSR